MLQSVVTRMLAMTRNKPTLKICSVIHFTKSELLN